MKKDSKAGRYDFDNLQLLYQILLIIFAFVVIFWFFTRINQAKLTFCK